ncbi:hypothetical protein [Paraherbaspirillum soli]|uniref:Uncharacterized protein n=1 Tax=Paraherbaspirillum soli TaxID=631222 RepID=A0ABW0M6D2_9BURK
MGAIGLVILLVSGFFFSSQYPKARYTQSRSTGWDSYFHVVKWGTLFSGIGAFIYMLTTWFGLVPIVLSWFNKDITDLDQLKLPHDDLKFFFWAVVTVGLACVAGWLTSRSKTQAHKALIQVTRDNPFEKLLLEAILDQDLVQVTLASRKVYIGVPLSGADFLKQDYISLLPGLSGHRDKDTLRLVHDINYNAHYEELDRKFEEERKRNVDSNIKDKSAGERAASLNAYRVVIPIKDIANIAFYDIDFTVQCEIDPPDKSEPGIFKRVLRAMLNE